MGTRTTRVGGGKVPTGSVAAAQPPVGGSKTKPIAIDDPADRARRAQLYRERTGRVVSVALSTGVPHWLTVLLEACVKPARRNPTLADALAGVPEKYRAAPAVPDPKDSHDRNQDSPRPRSPRAQRKGE
jgi:hypothetical protein